MRILYVGKHTPSDNQDELSITHALRKLGHQVTPIHESAARVHIQGHTKDVRGHDVLLFHKWDDVGSLQRAKGLGVPCVFWNFDVVDANEDGLGLRSDVRIDWVNRVAPYCVTGFCTDGGWVEKWNGEGKAPKLHWLMQGADERIKGPGQSKPSLECDILFTGSVLHGGKRMSHIEHLKQRWGEQFKCVGHKPRDRVHGRALADLYASAKVIIAPDGPIGKSYWSNRVYLTLGFGGFLLHPYCERLREHYNPQQLVMYKSRDELDNMIDYYTHSEQEAVRQRYRIAGYLETERRHLYRHRCKEMVSILEGVI